MGTDLQNVHSFLEQLRTFRLTVCGGLKMLSISDWAALYLPLNLKSIRFSVEQAR